MSSLKELRHRNLIIAILVLFCFCYAYVSYLPASPPPRYAFATLLSNFTSADISQRHSQIASDSEIPYDADGYYLGTRYLNYALQYHPQTRSRSRHAIPLLVLATAEVEDYKVKQLQDEGAEVIRIDKIDPPSWMTPGDIRYIDVLSKLRLWQLSSYDKICFVDADVLITSPLDGVFKDPSTNKRRPTRDSQSSDLALPADYIFAAQYETIVYDHVIPPWNWSRYFNAGFFVLSPSEIMYDLYMATLGEMAKGGWPGYFPEQDLLNIVHNQTGPMPWQILDGRWNTHFPTKKDLDAGVVSLHDKYWEDDQDASYTSDPALKSLWRDQVRQMNAFYRSRTPAEHSTNQGRG